MARVDAATVSGEPTSDFLAAERTFLAWIWTGLSLMGSGFVVARFGLYLEEPAATKADRISPGAPVV